MNDYNKTNSEELLKLLRDKDDINEKLRSDIKLLQLQRTEDHRRITGLEKAFDRELQWRKDGDYHYCGVEDCDKRQPLWAHLNVKPNKNNNNEYPNLSSGDKYKSVQPTYE
jgi:hypothetical protein